MMSIGCDLHTRYRQITMDTATQWSKLPKTPSAPDSAST